MKKDVDFNIYEKLAHKYGMSLNQAKANCRNMEELARESGLEFNLDTLILTNTFDAHRLTLFAKTKGLMKETAERILRAYYTESKHIGDYPTLIQLGEEVGLNPQEVEKMLASQEMAEQVRADEQDAEHYGIRSIPFYLINKKYAITGAQPVEIFVKTLLQIMEDDGPFSSEASQAGNSCDDDGCSIPEK